MCIIDDNWTKQHEGLRLQVYRDTAGNKSIGYGHNLIGGNNTHVVAVGASPSALIDGEATITVEQADKLFDLDMADLRYAVQRLVPEYNSMPKQVQGVLSDLVFNMGAGTLSHFHNTLDAFRDRRFSDAADGLENSQWYGEVGCRSKAIVEALREVPDGATNTCDTHPAVGNEDTVTKCDTSCDKPSIWKSIWNVLTEF